MMTICQTCHNPIDPTLGKTCIKCQPVPPKSIPSKRSDRIPGLTSEMEDVGLAMGINLRDPTDNPEALSPLNSLSAKKGQAFGLSPSMMRKPVPRIDLIPKGEIYGNPSAFVDEATSPRAERLNMNSPSAATGKPFGLSPSISRAPAKSKPMGLMRDVMEADRVASAGSPVGSLDDVHLAMGHGLADPLYGSNGREADDLGLRRRNAPSAPKGKAYGLSPTLLRKNRITSVPEMSTTRIVQADYGPPDTQRRGIDPFGRPTAGADRPNPVSPPRQLSPIFRGRRSVEGDDEPRTVESEELFGPHPVFAGSKERSPTFARHYNNGRWFRRSMSVGSGLTDFSEDEVQYSRTPPQRYSLSRHSLPEPIDQEPPDLSNSAPAAIEEDEGEGEGEAEIESKPGKKDRDRLKRWLASKLARHPS